MELERTALPGTGVAYSLATAEGRRIGVVAHLNGRRDLISYNPEDHDRFCTPLCSTTSRREPSPSCSICRCSWTR